jgi:hypothetical protein
LIDESLMRFAQSAAQSPYLRVNGDEIGTRHVRQPMQSVTVA